LNRNQFQIKSLDFSNSNNQLPDTVQIQAIVNGSLINMTLYQIQGLVNNASLANTKLLFMDGMSSQIQQLQTQNVVNLIQNLKFSSIYLNLFTLDLSNLSRSRKSSICYFNFKF
jgi:hypothetical protein